MITPLEYHLAHVSPRLVCPRNLVASDLAAWALAIRGRNLPDASFAVWEAARRAAVVCLVEDMVIGALRETLP